MKFAGLLAKKGLKKGAHQLRARPKSAMDRLAARVDASKPEYVFVQNRLRSRMLWLANFRMCYCIAFRNHASEPIEISHLLKQRDQKGCGVNSYG
eukprot:SAG31_NODE_14329_length_813_cov_1.392157_2_plen_95_part_00